MLIEHKHPKKKFNFSFTQMIIFLTKETPKIWYFGLTYLWIYISVKQFSLENIPNNLKSLNLPCSFRA